MDIIQETFMNDNIEGDKEFIIELVDGLGEDELKEVKKLARKLMREQGVYKSYYKIMYDNAFMYIAVRRIYKKEIEAYTRKKILGDYISLKDNRWVTLKGRLVCMKSR